MMPDPGLVHVHRDQGVREGSGIPIEEAVVDRRGRRPCVHPGGRSAGKDQVQARRLVHGNTMPALVQMSHVAGAA